MRVASTLFVLAPILYARAQTVSLFLPQFDPQPLKADVGGVDGQGRTTYIIQKGELQPGDPEDGFFGTATLVQGPSGASFTYEYPPFSATMGFDCTFSGENAICSGVDPEDGSTVTATQPIEYLDVQLGTTISPAEPTSSGSSASSGSSPAPGPGSSAPASASRSNSGASSASGSAPGSEPTDDGGSAAANVPALGLLVPALASLFWAV